MTQPQIGRFFSAKRALAAVGLVLGGLAFGGYCVYRVIEQNRISIGGFVVSGLLVLAGFAVLAMAFPKGCKACSKAFGEIRSTFPAEYSQQLRAGLAGQRADMIQAMAQAPLAQGQVARINLDYCEGCKQIGLATVSVETFNAQSQDYDVTETSEEHVVAGPMIAAVLQVASYRQAMTGAAEGH